MRPSERFACAVVVALLAVALALTGCSDQKTAIIGTWVSRATDSEAAGTTTWRFFKDGTLTIDYVSPNGTAGEKQTLRYAFVSVEDQQVLRIEGDSASDWFFRVEGDRLAVGKTKDSLAAVQKSDSWLGYDSGVYVRKGTAAARAEADVAAKSLQTSGGYEKVTNQSEIDGIASVEVNPVVTGSDGLPDVNGTVTNNSTMQIRVRSITVYVGQVPQGLSQTWELDPGQSRPFTIQNVNTNYGSDVRGEVSQLEVNRQSTAANTSSQSTDQETCYSNQRMIEGLVKRYRDEDNGDQPISVTDLVYVGYLTSEPTCPSSGEGYTIQSDDRVAPCSVHGHF